MSNKTQRYYPSSWTDEDALDDIASRTTKFLPDGTEDVMIFKNQSSDVGFHDKDDKEKDVSEKEEKTTKTKFGIGFIVLLVIVVIVCFMLGYALTNHKNASSYNEMTVSEKVSKYPVAMELTYIGKDNNQHDVYFLCRSNDDRSKVLSNVNLVQSEKNTRLYVKKDNGNLTLSRDKIVSVKSVLTKQDKAIFENKDTTREMPSLIDGND